MTKEATLYRLVPVESDPLPPGKYVILPPEPERPPQELRLLRPVPLDALTGGLRCIGEVG